MLFRLKKIQSRYTRSERREARILRQNDVSHWRVKTSLARKIPAKRRIKARDAYDFWTSILFEEKTTVGCYVNGLANNGGLSLFHPLKWRLVVFIWGLRDVATMNIIETKHPIFDLFPGLGFWSYWSWMYSATTKWAALGSFNRRYRFIWINVLYILLYAFNELELRFAFGIWLFPNKFPQNREWSGRITLFFKKQQK